MNIIELILDEEAMVNGIRPISIVEHPPIEEDFIALNKQKELQLATVDEEKKILMGSALIPNKMIYRRDGDEEYHIYFSRETVRKASELFLMNGNQNNATLEHAVDIQGLTVVESWIIEGDQDKSKLYGMDLPIGTWMVSMKVNNDEVWNDWVKTGKVKGFSIEGYFIDKVQMAKEREAEQQLKAIRAIIKKDLRTKKGKRTEMESFSNYPQSVRNNAKRGRELNEKNGNKCATDVGKKRGADLEAGRPVSMETIKRMASYLARAEEDYDNGDTNSCGYISYLLWGGKSAKTWAEKMIRENEKKKLSSHKLNFSAVDDAFAKLQEAEDAYFKAEKQVKTTSVNSFKKAEKLAQEAGQLFLALKKKAEDLGAPDKVLTEINKAIKEADNTYVSAKIFWEAIENL